MFCHVFSGDYWTQRRYQDIVLGIVISDRGIGQGTKVPIDFGEELYEWIRETAHRQRRPMADLVREALRSYRERQEPQLELPIPSDRQ